MGLLQQYIKDPSSVDPWFELPKNSNMNPAFENSELGVGNTNISICIIRIGHSSKIIILA